MSFADNLRQIRKERGLSQEALAEIMDVSRQAVSKWEQGEGYPEVEKLLLLSSALNVSLDSLMATEIAQIQQAMAQGSAAYELEYSVKVEKKWLRVSMVEE